MFQKGCYGQSRMIRYADDFVVCFGREADAIRFRQALNERLSIFGLEISPEKTKTIEFGPLAEAKAKRRGGKAATFDFLGFTHYCSRSRNGRKFRMKRITSSKKFTAKIRMFRDWLKANRTLPADQLMEKVASKLRGHFAYYGVTDNSKGISRFANEVRRLLHKWLNRRSQRGSMNWEKFNLFLKKYPLPRPRIMVNLFASS
ncbi:group II intron, maturase-specific domain protein [delta proteobacterium NaphS2]|nr:group II intron, maturase-specific domain protein [delta proteobacterium NaphS2]